MGFQISPGVQFTEKDLTGIIPSVSTTDGAYCGPFVWGPLNEITLVGTEKDLVEKFGTPEVDTATSFFTCANFLAYGDKLRVVRAADTNSRLSKNLGVSSINGTTQKIKFTGTDPLKATTAFPYRVMKNDIILSGVEGVEDLIIIEVEEDSQGNLNTVQVSSDTPIPEDWEPASLTLKVYAGALNATAEERTGNREPGIGALIKNDADYVKNYEAGSQNLGPFAAKFAGDLGNSIKVSVCGSAKAFRDSIVGLISETAGDEEELTATAAAGGPSPKFTKQMLVGSIIVNPLTGEERQVVSIQSDSILRIDSPFSYMQGDVRKGVISSVSYLEAKWEFADAFTSSPGTTEDMKKTGGSNDEAHVVVVDANGRFTGIPGLVLERYEYVSKCSNSKTEDGSTNYYKEVVNRKSKYVRWTDHVTFQGISKDAAESDWGSAKTGVNQTFFSPSVPATFNLAGGRSANKAAGLTDDRLNGYLLFQDADRVDVSLVMLGEADATLAREVVERICHYRLDCVAFVSPSREAVVGRTDGKEAAMAIAFRNEMNISSSYAVMDSGWKLQYDKYNDAKWWVPLNGDVAGLCVYTDTKNDPWWSPAGFNRGQIKSVMQLAYNPYKAERDDLYKAGINPVIAQPGEGTVLYGDKTLLARPSAFDRINVRRLFIVLEKAISRAAKYFLFEFNDEFTRQQFRSQVEPFLRDVQSRRGLYDFRVVCDRTNNTPEVIDGNQFVGDIYIKPARSINFIQLNFVAVRTGVEFSEIVGKV